MFKVLGQEKVLNLFKTSLRKGMLSHSYIVEGENGLGKLNMAKFMSASLMCENTNEDGPCKVCNTCLKINKDIHPDVRIIDNKTIKIDNIRDAIEEIYKRPYEGSKKVLIIKNFETATIESQNAILKTLEEPPKQAALIILARDTLYLLDTIKSRCQKLKLFKVDTILIKRELMLSGVDDRTATFASNYSEGNLKVARRASERSFLDLREKILTIALDIFGVNKYKAVKYSEELETYKDNIEEVLNIFTSIYRDIILLKVGNDTKMIINSDKIELLVEESYRLSYNRLEKALMEIKSARDSLTRDVNFQLTMEIMIVGIQNWR